MKRSDYEPNQWAISCQPSPESNVGNKIYLPGGAPTQRTSSGKMYFVNAIMYPSGRRIEIGLHRVQFAAAPKDADAWLAERSPSRLAA